MPRPRHHEDLHVWHHAIDLAVAVHHAIKALPREERIAFGDQVRRSAISIAANIAEGAGRKHRREFIQYLAIARGSLQELRTHVEILRRLDLVKAKELATIGELLDHVGRMLTSLIRALGTPPR